MNSPSAAPASAKTLKTLEEEIRSLKALLAAAEEAREYYKTKAKEGSSAVMERKSHYEKIIAKDEIRHRKKMAVLVAENSRLRDLAMMLRRSAR